MRKIVLLCFTLGLLTQVTAQKKKAEINPAEKMKIAASTSLDAAYPRYKDIALKIWDYAEVGYKEVKSSAMHQETLKAAGYSAGHPF